MINLSLVKKDFDIVLRGNLLILMAQMLFILIIISVNMGVIGYGVMATAFGWQLLMSVSAKEKENNSLGLLIAMPYDKGKIITSRYASALIGFVGMTVIYEIAALITNLFTESLLKMLTLQVFLTTLCAYAIFISITLPLYFKFDDTVVRGISLFLILAVTMAGYALWDIFNIGMHMSVQAILQNYSKIISIVFTILCIAVSRHITLKLFEKMEF